jgi:hypothetical protein
VNDDEMEARLRRDLTTVAGATRATNRWADVTARIAEPGAVRELDYVTVVAPGRRRRASRPLAAIVAFVAVVAGAFGVASLGGGDGSGTPEKAVEKVFGAIADEDPIGLLEAMAPSERKVLVPMLERLSTKLEQLHVASDGLDLDQLSGVHFDVGDLQLSTTQLSDDYALVHVSTRVGGDVRLSDLPFAEALQGAVLPSAHDPGPFSGQVSDLKLVTVKEDGGWYVGVQGSLARLADEEPGSPGPDFAGGFPQQGADSPEAAARQMIDAMYAHDVRREIELTPVSESAALHVWGPSLEAAMRRSDYGDSNVQLRSLTLAVEDGDDGAKVVRPTAYRVTSDVDGGQRSVEFDGRCVTTTFPRSTDSVEAGPHRVCGPFTGEPVSTILGGFYTLLGWGGPPNLAVVEEDGKWFVSVTRTLAASILDGVDHMSSDEAIRVVRSSYFGAGWADVPQEFWDACGVPRPAADARNSAGYDAFDRCQEQLPANYTGPVSSMSRAALFGIVGWSSSGSEVVDASGTGTTVVGATSTTIVGPGTSVVPTTTRP